MRDQIDWYDSFHHLVLWPEPRKTDELEEESEVDPDHPLHERDPSELPQFITFATDADPIQQPTHFWKADPSEREPLDPLVDAVVLAKRASELVNEKLEEHQQRQQTLFAEEAARKGATITDDTLRKMGVKPEPYRRAVKEFEAHLKRSGETLSREENQLDAAAQQKKDDLTELNEQRERDAKLRAEVARVSAEVNRRLAEKKRETELLLMEHQVRDQILQAFRTLEDELTTKVPHPYVPGAFKR
jgi:hypothetical protein